MKSHVHRHTARRHSVGHCNFTDTLARAIGTGVCTGLCKQAHPAGVITPLRVIDNVRARGWEGEREGEGESAKENKIEREERRGSDPRVVSLMSIRCPAKGHLSARGSRYTFRESAFLRYASDQEIPTVAQEPSTENPNGDPGVQCRSL